MKLFPVFVFLIVYLATSAQNTTINRVISKTDSVYSKVLKENRKIWVYVPFSDSNSVSSKQYYPVVYLLNGETDFYPVVERIRLLSEEKANKVIPKMMVVGIASPNRIRDLTPTHVSYEPYFDSSLVKTSGGAENFTAFLEKDLIPFIDSSYPANQYRMLIGGSLGGLFAVNTLINHTNLFNSYVAIDPYMRWDNQNLLKQAGKVLSQKKFTGTSLFLAIGNTMQRGWDTVIGRNDTSEATTNIRSILQLTDFLKSNSSANLHWSYKYYNGKDYNSVPMIGEHDALLYLFSNYKLPSFRQMLDSSFNADSAVTVHFQNFSKQMGYTVLPPEALVNELGYAFMLNKRFDKAYTFFTLNINNYPQSFATYNNLGDLYQVRGDKGKAIEYYTKALALRNTPNTRQKLERLKAEK
jgi:predicted alpha/beta superfamily hydrolase